jgi:hypothetical protein
LATNYARECGKREAFIADTRSLKIQKSEHKLINFQLQEKIKFVDRYIGAEERAEYERAQIFKMAVDAVEKMAKQWVIVEY